MFCFILSTSFTLIVSLGVCKVFVPLILASSFYFKIHPNRESRSVTCIESFVNEPTTEYVVILTNPASLLISLRHLPSGCIESSSSCERKEKVGNFHKFCQEGKEEVKLPLLSSLVPHSLFVFRERLDSMFSTTF